MLQRVLLIVQPISLSATLRSISERQKQLSNVKHADNDEKSERTNSTIGKISTYCHAGTLIFSLV